MSTADARRVLDELVPIVDGERLGAEHTITAEAMRYLREHRVPFNDVALLPQSLEKLAILGSVLEIAEIEAVQSFLWHAEGLRTRWREERENFPRLAQTGQRLPDLRELIKHLGRAIRNGEVDENFSPELRRIRKALSAARSRLTEKLESILRSPAYSYQLQEHLVTIRNGRFVIPVRAEQKRSVEGIVHGSSSSGATVFMEPLAVLEMNNELVRLQDEEQAEIARILAELTALIQTSSSLIESSRATSAYLELTFAKARFGREFDCVQPQFSRGPLLSLIKARHPLLEDNLRKENGVVSPVSLDMDIPVSKVRKVLKIAQEPISLETPIGEEEDSHLGDFIEDRGVVSPADAVININLKEMTEQVLNTLTPREERVIKMRFGLEDGTEHTLEEVGQNFAVTRERIRQIEAKALRKLRHPSRSRRLRAFLDGTGRD